MLATTPDLASFTEHLGGSHDYHHPHFINEKQKSLTQVCAMPKVTQWMTGITDSTFLEKPGSNSCYLSNSADSRGYENTGKGTTKTDETECHRRRRRGLLSLILTGGNTGNRTEWGGQSLEGEETNGA